MAKNPPSNQNASTRDKAKAMRDAQQKQESRVRNLIIAVVSVVVVGVIGALIAVIALKPETSSASGNYGEVQSGAQSGDTLPIANGGPIVVSSLGVNQTDPNVPNLDVYLSYTCHWCAYLEDSVGGDLVAGAEAGDYNLRFFPVDTATMSFIGPATNASLIVAQEAPDSWVQFHQSMFEFVNEEANVKQDARILQDPVASANKVKELAAAAGVPQNIIDTFGAEAEGYLTYASQAWGQREVTGRTEGSLGTPELVFMDTVVPWGQGTPEEIMGQITTAMDQIKAQQSSTGN